MIQTEVKRCGGGPKDGLRYAVLLVVFLCTVFISACANRAPENLYQRLGGLRGITSIVDNLLYRIAEDERIIDLFMETDIDRFREKLIEQLCNISGGPCEYTGLSMVESHRRLNITHSQFNNLVEDLINAMNDSGVPVGAQNELLALLAPMYNEVRNIDQAEPAAEP